MAENLKTTKYNDETSYKKTYGALYNRYTVVTGKLCPTGWHVPNEAEWDELIDFLGGFSVAGGKLKESGTSHWASPNTSATNSSGFTALPSDKRNNRMSYRGHWWDSSEENTNGAWYWSMWFDSKQVSNGSYDRWSNGFSVRCIKD